jgi:hypothetical protein
MIVLSDAPSVEAGLRTLKNPGIKLFKEVDRLVDALGSVSEEPCVVFDGGKDRSLVPLIHLIKKLRTDIPLYVLSPRRDDAAFLREMLKAKVDDLLFYRHDDEIVLLLGQIANGVQKNYAKNVAFIGSGTGATFGLLNTAAMMRTLYPGLKIGIVDCDYYKDDILLRLDAEGRKPLTLNDLLVDSMEEHGNSFESLLTFNRIGGMLVIPSGGQSHYFCNAIGREEEYLELLSAISMQNDITFFNIGSGLSELATSALRLADKSCTFVTQEPVPIQVLLGLSTLFEELNRSGDSELILNRYRKENKTITSETIESLFAKKITARIPDMPGVALASELERKPLTLSGGGAMGLSFKELAQKIVLDLAVGGDRV